MISIIIPTRTDAYLDRLLASIEHSEPGSVSEGKCRIIVGDNGLSDRCRDAYQHVEFVHVPDPFVFAQSINLCAARTTEEDFLILNDDTQVMSPCFISRLEALLADPISAPFGLLSPCIVGGVGNEDQAAEVGPDQIKGTEITLCFVAVLIRRSAWEQTGPLDERFPGMFEDADYCRRARHLGWKLGVTGAAVFAHGFGDALPMHGTYSRIYAEDQLSEFFQRGLALYEAKWGPLKSGERA